MNDLGRLEDLPPDYVAALRAQNLVPLWPALRSVLPPHVPRPATRATHWSYEALRPLLLQAGDLTPIEKAERRVLVLANPGHGPDSMQASAAMYLGLQLLLPGERAPAHRHTPNAVRMVIEGEGAWTTVEGQRCEMRRGDLILTPGGLWHEHGHDGEAPVVWLDVLDLPLVHYLEASYHVDGPSQAAVPAQAHRAHARGGLLPTAVFEGTRAAPMLRYPWADARAALESLAGTQPQTDAVQLTYVDPATGAGAQRILGFHALMLRPGQSLRLPARSPAAVFHLIEGAAGVHVETAGAALASPRAQCFALAQGDTCCVPGWAPVTLVNPDPDAPAFFFIADESPLHRKLGLLEQRG
jgi:gentisate 1,2-dioxygenase